MQMSAEQAFWLPLSNPKSEQLDIIQTPVEVEVPKELPNVSLVKTSFQKLKNHLASFDKVVKVRTTLDAITEGSWDFENGLYSELNEVKTVFNQMEADVVQCYVDKKYFDIQKKEVSMDPSACVRLSDWMYWIIEIGLDDGDRRMIMVEDVLSFESIGRTSRNS
ncbi:hypothetical protein Tco_0299676 [Tanacetum coccineum]